MTKRPDVSDAELDVLQTLWRIGSARVRDLLRESTSRRRAYTTVQTLLHRLVDKGFVTRDSEDGVARYSAAVTREGLLHHRLHDLSERLGDGSVLSLMHGLTAGRRLSKDEIADLREFVAELDDGAAQETKVRKQKKGSA